MNFIEEDSPAFSKVSESLDEDLESLQAAKLANN